MKRRWVGRDFHKKTLYNPFGRADYYPKRYSWRSRSARVIFIITIFGWIYALFFSPLFVIENIFINDLKKINKTDILALVKEEMSQSQLGIFTKQNIFIFDIRGFSKKFQKKYFVENLEINKNYPNTLKIKIVEKQPAVLALNNWQDFFTDKDGHIIEIQNHAELASSTDFKNHLSLHELRTLPIVFAASDKTLNIKDAIMPKQTFRDLIFIQDEILKKNSLDIDYIAYDPGEILKIVIKTQNGFEIYFDLENISKQMEKLNAFLLSKTFQEKGKPQYIDLRFGDRIYVK